MVLDETLEHRQVDLEALVSGIDAEQLPEHETDDAMLLERLGDHLLGVLPRQLLHGRVEQVLLDPGVSRQVMLDRLQKPAASFQVLRRSRLLQEGQHLPVLARQ